MVNALLYRGYFGIVAAKPLPDGSFTTHGVVGNRRGFTTTFATWERHVTADAALQAGIGWLRKRIDGSW